MKYSIILITHRDTHSAIAAIQSVLTQTYKNWELLVINDSPENKSIGVHINTLQDPRIRYLENKTPQGLNYSKNKGLDNISINSTWTLFLDDISTLAPDTLHTFTSLIEKHPAVKWFVTNKAHKNGISFTKAPQENRLYSYTWDYLIRKKILGPGLHCIENHTYENLRFSAQLRDTADWVFFFELAKKEKFFYHDHNSAIYTSFPKPEKRLKEYFEHLLHGTQTRHLLHDPYFIITIFTLYFWPLPNDRTA